MKGTYTFKIEDDYISYEFVLERQITILKGDSGTGKSSFVRMCEAVSTGNKAIRCNYPDNIIVLRQARTRDALNAYKTVRGCIFVCDENSAALFRSKRFAEFVKYSDNYFIIISRSGYLGMLSYSVNDIYILDLQNNGRLHKLESRYQNTPQNLVPDLVITEDSSSGYQFFSNSLNCDVISANGKSNIWKAVTNENAVGKTIFCIVDGASFGADIAHIMSLPREYGVYIFAPESFEWLLLHLKMYGVSSELIETYDYCDTKDYISWEDYYFKLIVRLGEAIGVPYKKEKLNKVFLRYVNEIKPLIEDLDDSVWK